MKKLVVYCAALGLFASAGIVQAAPVLACYVDTALLDQFTSPNCNDGLSGVAGTTTAVFEVLNLDPLVAYTIDWSNTNCTADANQCQLPITSTRASGQRISVTATITNLSTSAVTVSTANAWNFVDP